ncbi:hypothetical protein DPQ33_01905 [Oceanidesulfovibrio indonesiensis]|uniref:VacJ family lipoprotein n=1 Tax=Oceanidesulfovibrio indonesiensis TaxID=54767 RepID=A0A7M3MJP1_9BACT|nr:VacJ family lipoprotein [Oceanidesulfovibrio indonesiensis]TVM20005.1 hypothetical protein DPQ33_01905 [Oceanidesulfovibrio indonesiensis]
MNRILSLLLLSLVFAVGSACSAQRAPGPDIASQPSEPAASRIADHADEDALARDALVAGRTGGPAAGFDEFGLLDLHPFFFDDTDLAFDFVANGGLRHTGLAADEYEYYDEYDEYATVADPLAGWNRFWFNFNDALYTGVLQPLGRGYNYVMPVKARVGVRNFFDNLKAPMYIANSLLQGKFKGAGVHMSRFIGNTAFGFLGFAGTFNDKKGIVETDTEDFGQTLAVWGFGDGFYLVLPILGPTTLRDGIGMGVDSTFFNPITYIAPWPFWQSEPWQWWTEYGVWAYQKFNYISFQLDYYDDFKATAISPYAAMRDAYIQMRRNKIAR